jgi:hypothetical protein
VNTRLFLLLGGAAAFLWAFRRWRAAVQLAMVVLVLEGIFRKWIFLGAQDLIYFAKDVLLIAAYGGFLAERRRLRGLWIPRAPALYFTLTFAAVWGLFEIMNPELPNFFVGMLGFKSYFLYVPLLFVLPAVFPSDAALGRFLMRYLLLSIPVGLLAVTQFFSSSTSVVNTYARPLDDLSSAITFGSSTFVRVTGTFSFITGYSAYLTAIVMLSLTVLATTRWRLRGNFKVYLVLGMAVLGMLMTGSRGPVVIVGATFPLYWWLTVVTEKQSGATFVRLLIGLVLVGAFVGFVGKDALGAFQGRAAGNRLEMLGRIVEPFAAPFKILPDAGLLGYGIGATHQAATAVTKGIPPFSWLHGHFIEVEPGRVMLELGPIGFLMVYCGRLLLIVLALQQALRLKTLFHRSVAAASFIVFLSALPGGLVFDVTTGLLYWFFGGLLFLVMRLDRQMALSPPAGARVAAPGAAPGAAASVPRGAAVPPASIPRAQTWR